MIEESYISQILSTGRPLTDFQQTGDIEIFVDAERLPNFFNTNLVDDSRVVKVFIDDPQANIRIFYYQYLKLCFESEVSVSEPYLDKVRQLLLNNKFSIIFPKDKNSKIFNDKQFKRLLIQFFNFLGDNQITIKKALNRFPIIDFVLVYFFRTVLIFGEQTSSTDNFIPRQQLYDFLTSYFNVEVNSYDSCLHFNQTDIFAYEEHPSEVFMAYISFEQKQLHSRVQSASTVNVIQSNEVMKSLQALDQAKKSNKHVKIQQNNAKMKQSIKMNKNDLTCQSGFYQFEDFTGSHQNSEQLKEKNVNKLTNKSILKTNEQKMNSDYDQTANNSLQIVHQVKQQRLKQTPTFDQGFSQIKQKQNEQLYLLRQNSNVKTKDLNNFNGTFNFAEASNTISILGGQQEQYSLQSYNQYSSNKQQPSNIQSQGRSQVENRQDYAKTLYQNTLHQYAQKNNHTQNSIQKKELIKQSSTKLTSPTDFLNNFPKFQLQNNISTKYREVNNYLYQPIPSSHKIATPQSIPNTIYSSINESLYLPTTNYNKVNTEVSGKNPKKSKVFNVSDQFTSSLTLKNVSQPYKSSICGMKIRARANRKAIVGGMI